MLQSADLSPPRLVDGGEVRVRVTATTPNDLEPRSCSGELSPIGVFFSLPFSSCSARRIGPSRYELVLTREFPAAVLNRAFHLGNLVLLGGKGERYTSEPQRDQKLEVISTAVIPDLHNGRADLLPEKDGRRLRPGDRFRIVLHVYSATPIEIARLSLNLYPRDGRGVGAAVFEIRGERDWTPGWIERVEQSRGPLGTEWLTVHAKVPEDLDGIAKVEGIAKVKVGSAGVMNKSLQCLPLCTQGLEFDIED